MVFKISSLMRVGVVAAIALACPGRATFAQTDNPPAVTEVETPSAPAMNGKTVPKGTKARIAFVTNNASDYWKISHNAVDTAQAQLPDADIDFVMPAEGTATQQKALVEQEISNGAVGIVISPVDPPNQSAWIDDMIRRGITVVTQDSDAPASKRLCFFGTDNHAAGFKAGEAIKKALPGGGKIILFVGKREAQNATDRIAGITDALAGSSVSILEVRIDDAEKARARANAAEALTRYPNLAAEVGLWSYNGPAIIEAVKSANKVGKVKIVCFGAEDDTLAGIKSGAISAIVVQQPYIMAYDSVKMIDAVVHGDKSQVPPSGTHYVDTLVVDQSNVDAFKSRLTALTAHK